MGSAVAREEVLVRFARSRRRRAAAVCSGRSLGQRHTIRHSSASDGEASPLASQAFRGRNVMGVVPSTHSLGEGGRYEVRRTTVWEQVMTGSRQHRRHDFAYETWWTVREHLHPGGPHPATAVWTVGSCARVSSRKVVITAAFSVWMRMRAHWRAVCFQVQMRSYLGRLGTKRDFSCGGWARVYLRDRPSVVGVV